jgi:hypothetical protein
MWRMSQASLSATAAPCDLTHSCASASCVTQMLFGRHQIVNRGNNGIEASCLKGDGRMMD